jgi:hypothetical protein
MSLNSRLEKITTLSEFHQFLSLNIQGDYKCKFECQNCFFRVLTYVKQFFGNTLSFYNMKAVLDKIFP